MRTSQEPRAESHPSPIASAIPPQPRSPSPVNRAKYRDVEFEIELPGLKLYDFQTVVEYTLEIPASASKKVLSKGTFHAGTAQKQERVNSPGSRGQRGRLSIRRQSTSHHGMLHTHSMQMCMIYSMRRPGRGGSGLGGLAPLHAVPSCAAYPTAP